MSETKQRMKIKIQDEKEKNNKRHSFLPYLHKVVYNHSWQHNHNEHWSCVNDGHEGCNHLKYIITVHDSADCSSMTIFFVCVGTNPKSA